MELRCRPLFDSFIKEQIDANKGASRFPPKGTCFDYFVNLKTRDWASWVDGDLGTEFMDNDESSRLKAMPTESTFIPTDECAPLIFLARLYVQHNLHFLVHGPESSKSLAVKPLFDIVLEKRKYVCHYLPVANCSTANNILSLFRSFMHKSRGVFGPLTDMKLVIFLDNIGSVKPEIYGAQPPLELIGQLCDYGRWYNTANVEFQKVVDTILIGAMGPAGGGLFSIPARLMRHFNFMHAPKMRVTTMHQIFCALLTVKLASFSEDVKEHLGAVLEAPIDVHKLCVDKLLPIPSKLLRNIVRVLTGLLLIEESDVKESDAFARLYYHEMMREYNDRFNIKDDRECFKTTRIEHIEKHFGIRWSDINPGLAEIMFYKQVEAKQADVLNVCREMLEDHNRDGAKQLDIVIFDEALDHLSAMNRILSMPRGYAMLVGVKSSGRKSRARLSLHMSQMESFEDAITRTYSFTEWREDMKNLMKNLGVNDMPTGFVISDSQIIANY